MMTKWRVPYAERGIDTLCLFKMIAYSKMGFSYDLWYEDPQ